MNRPARASALVIALSGALAAACGDTAPTPAPADSGVDVAPDAPDAPALDVAIDRAPAVDTTPPPPDRAPPDVPTVESQCPAMVDLSSMTPGADGAVRVTGDNSGESLDTYGTYPAACAPGGAVGAVILYAYTMRADGFLRASTVNDGTATAAFDTLVAIRANCVPSARTVGCNDNAPEAAGSTLHRLHSTAVSGFLATGQRVYVAVAGRGASATAIRTGAFELSVREIALGALDGPCRVEGDACDRGLQCGALYPTVDARGSCRTPVATGMPCTAASLCLRGASCVANPLDTTRGTCRTDGAVGGVCLVGRTVPCTGGLSCTNPTPTSENTGLCRTTVALGAECDLTGVTSGCAMSAGCAPDATFTTGTCVAAGAAAGAPCRAEVPRCDGALECGTFGGRNLCRRTAAGAERCDVRYGSVACAAGASCLPGGGSQGVCATPSMEAEPNSTPATAQAPVTESSIFRGAIMPGTDIDCYRVTVPANAAVFVETNDNMGGCPRNGTASVDTLVDVYNAAGTAIATNDDISTANLCSRIDGRAGGALNRLAAGTYAVCVRSYMGGLVPSYFLTLAVIPPA